MSAQHLVHIVYTQSFFHISHFSAQYPVHVVCTQCTADASHLSAQHLVHTASVHQGHAVLPLSGLTHCCGLFHGIMLSRTSRNTRQFAGIKLCVQLLTLQWCCRALCVPVTRLNPTSPCRAPVYICVYVFRHSPPITLLIQLPTPSFLSLYFRV